MVFLHQAPDLPAHGWKTPMSHDFAAAIEAQARKTAAAMLGDRASDFAREPRQLDALETDPFRPRLSTLPPRDLRYRLVVLLGEEISTPRRHMGFGGETIALNLRAAIIHAERLGEIAEQGAQDAPLPSDDQIILEHVRQSRELAKKIQSELNAVYAGRWGPWK
jgi:hypothetical protein